MIFFCKLGRNLFYLIILVLMACSRGSDNHSGSGLQSGLEARPPNTSCVAPAQGPLSSPELTLEPAFPNLPAMGAVVAIRQAPGDTSQWYAALKDGRIMVFDNNENTTTATEFLNIQSQVLDSGEQGLLGMAFHPDYTTNGEIYLYYSTDIPSRRSIISRFFFVDNAWQENIILSIKQPYANHNGGNILFGPDDGYLYIGLGDGGSAGDPDGNGQNPSTLLGSMLRIDVDSGTPYAIPADNPYAGNPLCDDPDIVSNSQYCPEIFAYGLRNPWRWSFDRLTHELWVGDVGQNRVEEIDIVANGLNYGWSVMEGSECYNSSNSSCNNAGNYTLPVAEYNHNGGSASVVGGYVYRGNDPELAFLHGSYLFADTYSGQVWKTTGDGSTYTTEPLFSAGQTIYSFSESLTGELFVLVPNGSGTGNNIYRLAPVAAAQPATPIPETLSDTGCFESTSPLVPATGVIPYEVNVPLWSDGAIKQRYFAIPDGTQIQFTDQGDFLFPVGSVLVKHFLLNGKPIETRLLLRHQDYWGGYSYEWQYDADSNPVDAQLLTGSKTKPIDGQNWLYPSRSQCFECHTNVANVSLGLQTLQLNRDFTYPATGKTANQLDTLQAVQLLSSPLADPLRNRRLVALDDNGADVETRAKSYLHANCVHCHQPDGPTPVTIDLWFTTPLPDMNVCNTEPQEGDLGISGIKILDPAGTFAAPNSVITARMASLDEAVRMPPLATEIVDDDALFVLKSWVDMLGSCN
ncbi:MAG: PQQ-dependent sugar dehydrogenase [Gammaproteobacteria bacterium]|jgi:uncharacterized repeat protein (TIGR03806 family)